MHKHNFCFKIYSQEENELETHSWMINNNNCFKRESIDGCLLWCETVVDYLTCKKIDVEIIERSSLHEHIKLYVE